MFVAVHLALASAFVAAWLWWAFVVLRPFGAAQPADPAVWQYVLPWQGIIGLMLYVVVTGVSYAVRGAFLVNSLAVAAATADRLRAEAELAALRAHLDPHFLFGTLHGVMQLVRDDPAHAERALERLSELLRYVLRLDRARVRVVTLETEWQFAQSYLWLEQLRLGDRLRVDAQFEDDALACMVPPFTLQPLVENAIRHGLSPKPGGGRLRITARTTEDELELEIADDGLGRATPPDLAGPGLGIQSVVRRLRAHFGDACVSAVLATATDAGFSVRLVVPALPTDGSAERP
jgi:LytS/YehU family sensor histidine kinase